MSGNHRIHLFGAAGAGTTTLGRALASTLGIAHRDTDDYYWVPTDPPYRSKREPEERLRLLQSALTHEAGWVLSGSLCGWGDALRQQFTLAAFLYLDRAARLERLGLRERQRYGARLLPGGDMHAQSAEFLRWAASYETARAPIRSLHLHQAWMKRLTCPVLRLDSGQPVEALVSAVERVLAGSEPPGTCR